LISLLNWVERTFTSDRETVRLVKLTLDAGGYRAIQLMLDKFSFLAI